MKALVVGVGALASEHYVPWLAQVPGMEIGYLSRRPESARAVCQKYGGRVLDGWEQVQAFGADVAFNVTTDSQHAVVLEQLIDAGIPRILTEKPFVAESGQEHVTESDFFEGMRLAERARVKGVEIGLAFNYRFFETTKAALHSIDGGQIGTPSVVTADVHFACLSHVIDLLTVACGPIAALSALATTGLKGRTAPRAVAFTTEREAIGTMAVSDSRAWDDSLFSISVAGSRGSVSWGDLDSEGQRFDAETGYRTRTSLGPGQSRWDRYAASFTSSLTAFLRSVEAGAPSPIGIVAGLEELRVEAAIDRSIREARPIDVLAEFPIHFPLK